MQGAIVSIALLAGIIDRSYHDAENVLEEHEDNFSIRRSRRVGDIIHPPTEYQQQRMDAFGPLHNEKWCMHPRIG
jgi:hypothetical protein